MSKQAPQKRFLFVLQHAPHAHGAALKNKEALDFALACAAFEQKVSVLFINDGVFQLVNNQNTKNIQSKNHSASIAALGLYGVEHCFYDAHSAGLRGLGAEKLLADAKAINAQEIKRCITEHDFVFHY